MISAGIDVGTRFIKVCIVDGRTIIGVAKTEANMDIKKVINNCFKQAIKTAGIKKRKIKKAVATGYGSNLVGMAHNRFPESVCIAHGVNSLNSEIRTVIDIGRLFINIIAIDDKGICGDIITNEKCAAGGGRFLEMVSDAIEIPFTDISDYVFRTENPYRITSSCAVFAESEIITQMNEGRSRADIAASVINSIALRTHSLLEKIDSQDEIALVGGVAKIDAFRVFFENLSKRTITLLPEDPQVIAAYGAALVAQDVKAI